MSWAGRRVLVTGHTGFKGSWLALCLQARGARVAGLALDPPTEPSLFREARVGQDLEADLRVDLRDREALGAALADQAPELVLHLAAQAIVRRSYEAPVETWATNVMGTVHLLEALRALPSVRAVVVVTSDKCYENREWVWPYREDEPMGGRDPYSSSKGCAELVVAAWRASFWAQGPLLATARAGNVIGPGDWGQDRLVPDLARSFSRGEPARLRNPRAVRPWQHVLEPLSGYLRLAEGLLAGDRSLARAWNFGPDENACRTVAEVADAFAACWGEGARWELDEGAHPHEAHLLKLDASLARARLGWRPRLDLDRAVAWTCEGYRCWHEGGDLGALCREQIRRYEELAPCA